MTLYLILSLLSNSYIYYLCMTAPIGYEDEDGFHYGDKQ